MRSINYLLLTMLVVIFGIVCLSCSEEQNATQTDPTQDLATKPGVHSPGKVFTDFYQAIQDRDDDKLLDLIHIEAPIWDRERFGDFTQRQKLWRKHASRIHRTQSEVRILEERIVEDSAFLKTEFTGLEASTLPRTFDFTLRLQTGQWKLWLTGGVIQLSAKEKQAPAGDNGETLTETASPEKKKSSAGGAMKLKLDLKKKPAEEQADEPVQGDKPE